MKKFFTIGSIVLALLLGAAGVGLGIYNAYHAFENQPVQEYTGEEPEVDVDEVKGLLAGQGEGGLAFAAGDAVSSLSHKLKGGNTHLVWETGKVQLSKRYDFEGTWTSLGGMVIYNPEAKEVKALFVKIAIESFNSYGTESPAPGGLVNTVLGKGQAGGDPWFNYEDHPNAVFTASEVIARDQVDEVPTDEHAPEDWTHLVKGEFELNGEKKPLALLAGVAFEGDTLAFKTSFGISREAYRVKPKEALPGTTVDDVVVITTSFKAEPDPALADKLKQSTGDPLETDVKPDDAAMKAIDAMADKFLELGREIDGLKGALSRKDRDIKMISSSNAELASQIEKLSRTIQSLESRIAEGATGSAPKPIDVASLPKQFTSELTYLPNPEKNYPGKGPFKIDMVLVPGDPEAGIAPFYMAKHEVTWEMFYDWAYSADITESVSAALQAKKLRPSPLYEDCDQLKLKPLAKRPAISMSRTTAEAFAKWVSERTGKRYRLPTSAEWGLALKLGGGVPASEGELFEQAVLDDNAEEQEEPPFLLLTAEVGSKKPNKLGIHDMLGNASEWVTGTGADRVVRGGHFKVPAGDLKADWQAVEDQNIWNKTYPQLPLSEFWYRDHYYQGIRLVCEVQ